MIDKCLDILQSHLQALLGVDFWCWGEFPWMTKSITCLKTFVSFPFIVYHIHDPSSSPLSVFTAFAKGLLNSSQERGYFLTS